MKSSVAFLKSLLTNSFMLGNGFLSMFGCVCLYLKMGIFYFSKDFQEICMSLALYPCSFLICVMMSATSLYCIDGIIFSSLIAWFLWLPRNCIDTDHFRAYYTPKPKIQLRENEISPMAFAEAFPWHWSLKSCNFAEVHKDCKKSAFTALFSRLLESKEEPNLDGVFCH